MSCHAFDDNTCTFAVHDGDLELLKEARRRGYPWISSERSELHPAIVAAKRGDMAMVQWIAVQPEIDLHDHMIRSAAQHGHVDMVHYLMTEFPHHITRNASLMAYAAESGSFPLMQWLYDQGCSCDHYLAACFAIQHGNLKMLEWLVDHGCSLKSELIAMYAVEADRIDILEYLLRHEANFLHTFSNAAFHGRLKCLQWLYAHKQEVIRCTRLYDKNYDLEIEDYQRSMDRAVHMGCGAVVRYLHRMGPPNARYILNVLDTTEHELNFYLISELVEMVMEYV